MLKDKVQSYSASAGRYWRSVLTGQKYSGSSSASTEQSAYAAVLDVAMKLGLAGLVICFGLYVSGIVPPKVPLDELPNYWSLSVHDYIEATKAPTGWDWLGLVYMGDYLAIVPVAFLALITILCYARILPILLVKKDRIYATIVVLEIVVLVVVALGVVGGSH